MARFQIDEAAFTALYGQRALPAPGTAEEGYLMWVPKRAIDAEEG